MNDIPNKAVTVSEAEAECPSVSRIVRERDFVNDGAGPAWLW